MMNFQYWVWHFLQNVTHLDHIEWHVNQKLNAEEFQLIAASIAQFQRGEHSEGKHLIDYARSYAEKTGDQAYYDAVVLFIREEQRHAMVLGKYMSTVNLPTIKGHWVDGVFRFLRKLSNHENSIRVLTTAEIIAAVYYQGLRDATGDSRLKAICQQLLDDEAHHLKFQAYTLHALSSKRSPWLTVGWNLYHRFLLMTTIGVVWTGHRRVMKAGGIRFRNFWKECFREFDRVSQFYTYFGLEKRMRKLQQRLQNSLAYENAHH